MDFFVQFVVFELEATLHGADFHMIVASCVQSMEILAIHVFIFNEGCCS